MTKTVFLDTNVLVYAHDPTEPTRRERAERLLDVLVRAGIGTVSVQVLAEFFDVATKKLRPRMPRELASSFALGHERTWTVLPLTADIFESATESCLRHSWRIYDAQIWAAAKANGIPYVLTEDFGDGRCVEGVTFVDPFSEHFTLASIGLADPDSAADADDTER
jgi:predicted nucleic acid-binding protein